MSVWSDKVTTYSPKVWLSFNSTGVPTDNGSLASSLTLTGSAPTTGVSSPQGSAYTFTGATRYSVSNATGTFDDKIYTIEAIIKQSWQNTSQTPTIFRTQNAGSNSYVLIRAVKSDDPTNPGKLQAYIQGSSGTANFFSSKRIDDGEWHHVALVVNDTSQKIYIDGVESGSSSTTLGTVSVDSSTNVKYYAGFTDSPEEDFVGSIDEIVIYNSALGGNEIKALSDLAIYQDHSSIKTNGYQNQVQSLKPTVWYRLDDASGTPTNYGSHSLTLSTNGTPTANQSGGISKTCYYFGGSAGYASTTAMPTNTFNDKIFTIETWFKLSSTDTAASVYHTLYVGVGTNGQVLYFRIVGGTGANKGKLEMTWLASGYSNKSILSTGAFNDNNWHHALLVADGTNIKMYVDNVQVGTTSISTSWPTTMTMDGTTNKVIGWADTNEGIKGYLDEFAIYNTALTTTEIGNNYSARYWANYDAEVQTVSNSTFPMPGFSATSSVSNTYTSGVVGTASVDIVDPALSTSVNVDGAHVVGEASATMVGSTVEVISNIDYAHTVATASALMANATGAAQKYNTYIASPATASALLSSNLFFGKTSQDTLYNISLRQLYSFNANNNDAKNGTAYIAVQYGTNGSVVGYNYLALKESSGLALNNEIVKVKFDTNHVTVNGFNGGGGFKVNVYVFTSNPSSGTFETMSAAQMGTKELIYQKRLIDDGSTTNIDLTPAFADSRAKTYGILLEMDPWWNDSGIPATDTFKRIEIIGTDKDSKAFYVLSSDSLDKNINANVMTATALTTDAFIYVERYVNFTDGVATASAEMANAIGSITISADISASAMTASALQVNSTFNADVIYTPDHLEAFAVMAGFLVYAQGTVTLSAEPSTASAVFHMPQANIGENNIVDHMNASALLVMPTLIIPESVDVMVTTASALMVNPSSTSELLGSYMAQPMMANAIYPNPPAYMDLFADPWYASLYAQHSVRNQLPAGYNTSFLKLFEDQNTDITQSTPATATSGGKRTLRQLFNNLSYGIAVNSGPENDTTFTPVSDVVTDYSTAENESRLSVGYIDPYSRKAIRLQNIAIQMAKPLTFAKTDFTLEFSIKTTKSDQIISYADWLSATSSQRVKTTFNLLNGKLNILQHSGFYAKHPKELLTSDQLAQQFGGNWVTGNTRIDDGQWHHIVMQFRQGPEMDGGIAGRTQIWIDGNLDIQRFGMNLYEPDFIGANLELSTYAPDFYTSAWSMDAAAFVSERDIDLHYFNYIKYDPILAAPMTATLTMTQDNTAKGNRGRALMLYWWPTSSGQNKNLITSRFDSAAYSGSGEFDINMFDNELETMDYINQPPQQYYGWDVFPVDITGYYVSDLVKDEAYGGTQNIIETTLGGAFTGEASVQSKFKANRMGYFRDTLDDTRRYIDLVNDIDLSKFDAIFFKNYPDQSNEVDAFARNEIVDPYFNILETKIYEDFIKSLRSAVDTGISLMVNNPQLALDLKIVDRIEVVPDLQDISGYRSDPYTPTIVPDSAASLPVGTGNTVNIWEDTFKNNRIRLINTVTGLTDWRCNIFTKAAYWENDDTLNYGGANRPFKGFEHRSNGLQLGDEFFIPTFQIGSGNSRNYLATPISNVKAGTPLTAFASTYYKGLDPVDNPYKNYVTSIAVKPGDVLDGRQVGGKIFVNFTDAINQEDEYVAVDAIHTDWINIAYQDGVISLSQRNAYLASPNLLENQLSNGQISQSEYNKLKLWQSNGMFILSQAQQLESGDGKSDFTGDQTRKGTVRKTSRLGTTSSATVSFGGQFFAFSYARQYDQLVFDALSMTTRGFRWLSDRVAEVAQTQTHTAFAGSAEIIQPTIIVQKEAILNVQSMVANATKIPAVGFAGNDVAVLSLPFTATAIITQPVKNISATVMTASAEFTQQTVIRTTAQDQVVLYILHEDPILYLREDIIK